MMVPVLERDSDRDSERDAHGRRIDRDQVAPSATAP